MDKDKTESTDSFPVLELFLAGLTLLFIYFKIDGTIDWSWWLVSLPVWIIPAAVVAFAVGALIAVSTLVCLYWLCKLGVKAEEQG